MNKKVINTIFPEAAADIDAGNCVFCKKAIHPNKDFRDEISLAEYGISGLCQACQDETFGVPNE